MGGAIAITRVDLTAAKLRAAAGREKGRFGSAADAGACDGVRWG
jgi:hypothetical protein